ncbi:MAG: hypothetical protein FJ026_12945 [Chloroflexi bacterium]|nr:hypothetical protein [Chloroflexota bacterium]
MEELAVGQVVVHRRYGAGTVLAVRAGQEDEEHEQYYVIEIPSRALQVHLPVDSAGSAELRGLATLGKLTQALDILGSAPAELPKDYRERHTVLTEGMQDGAPASLARGIRDLSALQSKKALSEIESALFTNAKRQLAGELALVARIGLDEAMRQIERALQQSRRSA